MKHIYRFIVVVFTIAGLLFGWYLCEQNNAVETFDLADYQEIVTRHPCDMVVGEIRDQETAKHEADKVFVEVLGIDLSEYKTYWISFDADCEVWHIAASKVNPAEGLVAFGGCPEVLIKSNGEVLSVWHSK